jgi:hypothetical protein
MLADERHALEEAGLRLRKSDLRAVSRRQDIEEREDIGARIAAQDLGEHALGATDDV